MTNTRLYTIIFNMEKILKSKSPQVLFSLFAIVFLWGHVASGEMIITVNNAQIPPESSGFVDVFVSSTVTQNVKLSSYQFSIAATPGNTSQLLFSNSFVLNSVDPSRQSNSEQSQSNYLFSTGFQASNFVATRNSAIQLTGLDESTMSNGFNMVADQSYLLARLELLSIQPGQGIFSIAMSTDPNFSYFENSAGDSVNITSFNSGVVTITAVPEPTSLLLLVAAGGVGVVYRRTRSKRKS